MYCVSVVSLHIESTDSMIRVHTWTLINFVHPHFCHTIFVCLQSLVELAITGGYLIGVPIGGGLLEV